MGLASAENCVATNDGIGEEAIVALAQRWVSCCWRVFRYPKSRAARLPRGAVETDVSRGESSESSRRAQVSWVPLFPFFVSTFSNCCFEWKVWNKQHQELRTMNIQDKGYSKNILCESRPFQETKKWIAKMVERSCLGQCYAQSSSNQLSEPRDSFANASCPGL